MKNLKKGFTRIVDFKEATSSRTKGASLKLTTGFTLIELLVVIAIIGILASVVMVSMSSSKTKAKTSAFKSEVTSLISYFNTRCAGSTDTISKADIPNNGYKTFDRAAGTTILNGCNVGGVSGAWALVVVANNGAGQVASCNQDACSFDPYP